MSELNSFQAGERVAVITGAAGGMGRACSRRMGLTHRLVLADVAAAACVAEADALRSDGYDVAEALEVDVSDGAAVQRLAQAAAAAGPLGALVHTAGVSSDFPDWKRILRINFQGTALLLEAFLAQATHGSVVCCIASTAGHLMAPNAEVEALYDDPHAPGVFERLEALVPELAQGLGVSLSQQAYIITKRGIIRMVKDGVPDWAEKGARIVCISPGLTLTSMGRSDVRNPFTASLLAKMPLRRWGTAMDVANAANFLCSKEASFITGCDLLVDGGFVTLMTGRRAVRRFT